MPYDLFISYSHQDNQRGQVRELCDAIIADFQEFAGLNSLAEIKRHRFGGSKVLLALNWYLRWPHLAIGALSLRNEMLCRNTRSEVN